MSPSALPQPSIKIFHVGSGGMEELNVIKYVDGFMGQKIAQPKCLAFHPYKVCGGEGVWGEGGVGEGVELMSELYMHKNVYHRYLWDGNTCPLALLTLSSMCVGGGGGGMCVCGGVAMSALRNTVMSIFVASSLVTECVLWSPRIVIGCVCVCLGMVSCPGVASSWWLGWFHLHLFY